MISLVQRRSLFSRVSLQNHLFWVCLLLNFLLANIVLIDYNGDMISDFIVSTYDCPTYLWLGGAEHNPEDTSPGTIAQAQAYQIFKIPPQEGVCLTNLSGEIHFKFANPHSSGFLNLNAFKEDMTPDIFLDGRDKFEYVLNKGKGFGDPADRLIVT